MIRIWLVADDYGISPSVNAAIRDLLTHGRINATSVMVVAPAFNAVETRALAAVTHNGARPALGLHLTLTAPFKPLTADFRPLAGGKFLSLGRSAVASLLGQYAPDTVAREVTAQITAFRDAFGRAPDFIDGHQHVHLLPRISEGFLAAVRAAAPDAWVRQCERAANAAGGDIKATLLDGFSRRFRVKAAAHGVRTNSVFAGAYAFRAEARYSDLFPLFLTGMRDGGVIMCHPGVVDATLRAVDPLTSLREREYDYFRGDAYPAAMRRQGIALMP
jgi:predicted glycoside hydrolase/deacetylase ChbG (UPF0249 family)